MAHFAHGAASAVSTPPEWLRVGATIGQLANEWAQRDDLVAYIGPGAGGDAPACYKPDLSEVEVSVAAAFGPFVSPKQVGDLSTRKAQYEWAKATGAIYHEAFHARFSKWSIPATAEELKDEMRTFDAMMLLEEGRIEAQGILAEPRCQPFLRRCAMEIVLSDIDFTTLDSVRQVGNLVGLVHARVEAGVLSEYDVRELLDVIDPIIGEARIERLREIAATFQAHKNDSDVTSLYPLAREWVRLLDEAAEERGEKGESGSGGGEGEGSTPGGKGGKGGDESEGEDSENPTPGGLTEEEIQEVIDAFYRAADKVEARADRALDDQQEDERWAEMVVDARAGAAEKEGNAAVASRVFGRPAEEGLGGSRSRLHNTRPPTAAERRAAVIVARELDRAKYRERSVTKIRSEVPPGRLKTRAVVAAAGARAAGVMNPRTEPWQRKARKHTDEPTLTVGQIVDVSGSMGAAMKPCAVATFVMSEACKRIQARTASVYYGQSAFPTLRPGQYLTEVQEWTAPDGTERFNDAFRAIDGSLNLLYGDGARILVITSDGAYTDSEVRNASAALKRCEEMGVVVIWYVPEGTTSYVKAIAKKRRNVRIVTGTDPEGLALSIGQAAVEALRAMSSRSA